MSSMNCHSVAFDSVSRFLLWDSLTHVVTPCVRLVVASKNLNNLKRDNNGSIAFTGVSRTSAG
jgi:hypothetical protein